MFQKILIKKYCRFIQYFILCKFQHCFLQVSELYNCISLSGTEPKKTIHLCVTIYVYIGYTQINSFLWVIGPVLINDMHPPSRRANYIYIIYKQCFKKFTIAMDLRILYFLHYLLIL